MTTMNKEQIIEKDGKKYKVIEIIKDDEQEVIVNRWNVTEFEKWYDNNYCLEAVKQDGYALKYVKEQTEELCLEAVKQNEYALQYVDKRVFNQRSLTTMGNDEKIYKMKRIPNKNKYCTKCKHQFKRGNIKPCKDCITRMGQPKWEAKQ